MKRTYRAWVEGGANGFFLTPDIYEAQLVIASERVLYSDLSRFTVGAEAEVEPGYIIEQTYYDPATDGAANPGRSGGLDRHGRKRLERAEDVVAEGWLSWETVGAVVDGSATDDGERVER